MRVVKLNKACEDEILKKIRKIIESGGIVIGPTDTVYGIFCDARSAAAIKKIFTIKGRAKNKALPIFVRDVKMARFYAYISDAKAKFLEKIWPGVVTVVFYHKGKLPKVLTGGKDTIALRISHHLFLQKLFSLIDFPLAQTSANVSGGPPARDAAEVKKYFKDSKIKPDLVIDGGMIDGNPSAVIDCTGQPPKILRTGLMSFDTLNKFWDSLGMA